MNMFYKLFVTYKSLTLSLLFIFLFSATVSLAAPLYNSTNTTLNPQCAPTDPDCRVSQLVTVENGGTGATTLSAARNNLGLSYANTTNVIGIKYIATWGDSLTAGSGGTPYPTQLATLTGYSVYNGGVGGETSTQIKTRMLADTAKHALPTIIWAGRNNPRTPSDDAQVIADIAAMVSALGHENYLVLGVINGQGDGVNTSASNGIINLNNQLAAIYGDHFIDIRTYLVSQYNPGNAQDVIDHANDIPPTSLSADGLHLNTAGYEKVASKIYEYIDILQPETANILTSSNLSEIFSAPFDIGTIAPSKGYFSSLSTGTAATGGSLALLGKTGTSSTFNLKTDLGNYLHIQSTAGGASPVVITSLGVVGIGTTTPSSGVKLEVNGNIGFNTAWELRTDGASSSSYIYSTKNSPTGAQLVTSKATVIGVYGSSTEGLMVRNHGNTSLFEIRGSDGLSYFSGNVGIKTSSASTSLTIGSGQITVPISVAGAPSYSFTGNTTSGFFMPDTTTIAFSLLGSRVLDFYNNTGRFYGDVSLGSAKAIGFSSNTNPGAAGNDVAFSRLGSGVIALGNGIAGSSSGTLIVGNVGISNVGPGFLLHVGSSSTTTGTTVTRFQNAGGTCDVIPSTSGGITCSSDYNLKKNITTLANTPWVYEVTTTQQSDTILNKVLALQPVQYNWNVESDADTKHAGFIAQDVQQLFPELVSTDSTTGLLSLNYTGLLPYAIQALQDINITITTLADTAKTNTLRDGLIAWLSGDNNGIEKIKSIEIDTKTVTTDKLCIRTTCVTQEQLELLLQQQIPQVPEVPQTSSVESAPVQPVQQEESTLEVSPIPEAPVESVPEQ